MPRTVVILYQEREESVPVLEFLRGLRRSDVAAFEKCVAAIQRLAELGHELRRPLADILQDGICELRIRRGRVNYRILYFFHGRNAAVLAHAATKEGRVPEAEIKRALVRKQAFAANPEEHTYTEPEDEV